VLSKLILLDMINKNGFCIKAGIIHLTLTRHSQKKEDLVVCIRYLTTSKSPSLSVGYKKVCAILLIVVEGRREVVRGGR
jgi:hypothetical protein